MTSDNLLERCQQGDPDAWESLFRARVAQVYRWAVLLGMRADEAEDVAQEVLVTAARRIDSCENERALTSWLFQITRRHVANARRRWWRRFVDLVAEPLDTPAFRCDRFSGAADTEIDVRRALRNLPDDLRELAVLSFIDGYSRTEVAEILGIPAGTVASRLRALESRLSAPAPLSHDLEKCRSAQ